MPDLPASSAPSSPDKNLPPVQPPTLGFLVQLFVIPGMIVAVIVAVWMLFNWLAHMGSDPGKELQVLASGSQGRWQAAYNLAKQLADDKTGELRGNTEMARKLAGVLTTALDTPLPKGADPKAVSEKQEALQLRYYLVRSLGLFTVDPGTAVLLRAAAPSDDSDELPVQIAALDSLGQLAAVMLTTEGGTSAALPKTWEHEAAVRAALLAASQRPEVELRERAAFHLGQFADPAVTARLAQLTEDAELFTRFHAATSLAMRGDARALPVLRELLEITPADVMAKDFRLTPEQIAELGVDKQRTYKLDLPQQEEIAAQKRLLAIRNALESLLKLRAKNSELDLSTILPSVERLQADPNRELREISRDTLQQLQK